MLAFPEMLKSLTPLKSAFKKGASYRKLFLEKIIDLLAIVISIYLALSIEGWSEKRHEHKRLIQYYQNLITEIEMDTATLNNAIHDAEEHISRTKNQIEILEKYKPEFKDTISELMSTMTSASIFYATSMTTLKSMQMGGDIKLIENLALRDSLIRLDEKYINLRLHEDLLISFVENDLFGMLRENFNLLKGDLLNEMYFTDIKYHNLVYFFFSLNNTRLNLYKEVLPKAINTLDILKTELAENM